MRLLVVALLIALALAGCVKKDYPPGRDVIDGVEILEAESIDSDEALDGIATADTRRFLGIWEGVIYDYELFDETLLARDLLRIERYYRARGYYEAKVVSARVIRLDERHVRVEIVVQEGPPTQKGAARCTAVGEPAAVCVGRVDLSGTEQLPIALGARAYSVIQLEAGEPFDEASFEASKKALDQLLADNGYAFAKIEAQANIDIAKHRADVAFRVTPGPVSEYGKINIVGLQEIPEDKVRSTLLIEEGEPYSRATLQEAQDALFNLEVFSNVEIREDRTNPNAGKVPITVVVRESLLRTLRVGVGATADVLRVAVNLRLGWEDRNFLGGMRRFSIDTRPGVNFFPTRIDHPVAPTKLLPENRLRAELRQPAFIEGRTTGFIASEYNVLPLLFRLPEDLPPDQETIIGYHEVKASTGVERAFFNHHLFVTPSYNWEARFPFSYQGTENLDHVIVSYPELVTTLDFRDDRIEPHKGFFVSNSFQVAGYIFQGTVSDFRIRPEASAYLPLMRDVTLALRTRFGFLFPESDPEQGGYGETRNPDTEAYQERLRNPQDPEAMRDQHKLLFRAFYSGGPNSNRGYAYQGVGPQGPIGFLIPARINCLTTTDEEELEFCRRRRPLGGFTLWEASVEVRFPISGPVRGALFADASDVAEEVGRLRLSVPHLSVGPGLRYKTPVGPLRLDIGYRVPSAQEIGVSGDIPPTEGERTTIFGLPVAVHIAIGEPF